MASSSLYHGFAVAHAKLIKELTEAVCAAAAVERLYLLGLALTHRRTETLFSKPAVALGQTRHARLLVVVKTEGAQPLNNLTDKIESALHPWLACTAVVLSAARFTGWLSLGHPFARSVKENGFLCYQKEALVLPEAIIGNEDRRQKEVAQSAAQAKRRAQEFMAGAELYSLRLQNGLAAFLLHQAAEQMLRALLVINTGLRLNKHSLDRLLRCCGMFCPELPVLFSENSEKDKHCLRFCKRPT